MKGIFPKTAKCSFTSSLYRPYAHWYHLSFLSLSTSPTDCLRQQCVPPPVKIACVCHSHNGSRINTFIPILAALPLCPPTPKNRTACKTQPPCQLITALLLQSFVPYRWPTPAACPAQLEILPRGQWASQPVSIQTPLLPGGSEGG